jgi:hypothetical protein
MQLEDVLQKKVDDLRDKSNEEYDNENFIQSIKFLEEAWEKLPEPKGAYDDSYYIAEEIIRVSLLVKDLKKAKKWSEIIFSCDLERIDSGEREFFAGQVAYESGEMEIAKEYFIIANKKSRGRCFEDEDEKYRKFFRSNV